MRKSRRKWVRFSRILWREGVAVRTSGTFYKAIVQETLLSVYETWLMTPNIGRTLGGIHHRVALCLAGMKQKYNTTGIFYYLPLEAAMTAAGVKEVDTYALQS